MPTQEGIGLDEQQGLLPAADPARQEHQERAVDRGAARVLHASREHDQLLAQERILGNQVGLAADQVGQRPGEDGGSGGLRGGREATTDCTQGGTPGAGDAPQELSEHGQRSLASGRVCDASRECARHRPHCRPAPPRRPPDMQADGSARGLAGPWPGREHAHGYANQPGHLGEGRSHWQAKAPLGQSVEWDARIINDVENELIAWQSTADAQIANAGSVRFTPAPFERGTEVRVTLSYAPPAGKTGVAIAKLLGEEPGRQVSDDLRRFKQLLEAGELPTNDRQSAGPGGGIPTLTGAISEVTSEPI